MSTEPTEGELRTALEMALAELCHQHRHLLSVDANERSLTHWLAVILARLLPALDVDCEYNRSGDIPKRLSLLVQTVSVRDTDAQTVYPDIIVHRRGSDRNFLVIEAKKTTRANSIFNDMNKLRAYVDGALGYRYGALVVFETRGTEGATVKQWLRAKHVRPKWAGKATAKVKSRRKTGSMAP